MLLQREAFLYPGFRELYQELSKMGFMVSMNTNGTMITDDTVSWLSEMPPARMNITLYGASNETYGRLCRNPNGYTQTVQAVRMLKEAGISVKLNASMTPYNIDDLDGIYKTAEELDVYVQAAAYMYPPVRKSEDNVGRGDRFSAEEAGTREAEIDRKRLTQEQFQMRREKIILPVGCRQCRMKDLCPVCAASVYAETGRFDEVPQYLCRMTRAKLEHTLAMQN